MAEPADLLALLHPIRPPAASVSAIAAEALAALALGLALAALTLALAARRRPSRRAAALRALDATRALPPQARLARQIALLRDAAPDGDWAGMLAPDQRAALRAALYGAAPAPDPQISERAVRRALAQILD